MGKQKVCIVGGGLTGLLTAIVLSKSNLAIDLFANDFNTSFTSLRSTAFSNSSFKFLKKHNLLNHKMNEVWPINDIKIYDISNNKKPKKILEFQLNKKKKKILFMINNKDFILKLKKKIKIIKKIKIKKKLLINKKKSNYNLIINCTGANSKFSQIAKENKFLKENYKQKSLVTKIIHSSFKNDIARQIFLEEGPLALLPVSNTETSVIWTVKKELLSSNFKKNESEIKKKLKNILLHYLRLKKFSKLEAVDINFQTSRNYYAKRFLNFGDALHQIHPFAGQGFNMIIRDLIVLKNILDEKISLGLDIGDDNVLEEFSSKIKSTNFIYSYGIDFLNKIFSIRRGPIKTARNLAIEKIEKNLIIKNFFLNFADKGFLFDSY